MSMPAELIAPTTTLAQLLQGIAAAPDLPVTGIADDSRKLKPGYVFFACQGATSHGLAYLQQAIQANVSAVVFDSSTGNSIEAAVPMIPVPDLEGHLGEVANRWFDSPSKHIQVTGVTGTNGKTTVAYLIRQCMDLLNQKCGYIGTLGSGFAGADDSGIMTTPPCIEIHETLAAFRDQGARHAALEVSSHALDQRRVGGVHFNSAIFTNLSRDHIDYHGSMRAYFESKSSLFLDYDVRNRIVSLDTEFGAELADLCGANVITVSTQVDRIVDGRPHVFVRDLVATPSGLNISVASSWGSADLSLPLIGDFNVANAVQVLALLLCHDVSLDKACNTLGKVSAPPGRMQPVLAPTKNVLPAVYVDYSHTPASLEAALRALRGHCRGKLWCVFGCGGDRDRGKRSMMGKIAEQLSDCPVVTSDNPRTEDPDRIVADVLEGMSSSAIAIVDRRDAIAYAISNAGFTDTILVAGKGHEDYQVIGAERLQFSDVDVSAKCLVARDQAGAERK
ncbi:MAG: UDP-N-acetylmuramoyl-L-alanyl-D-glutamate--2,6-diaminopimelate ligase [Proteobacteria bacterium]|nr:UDP-N-acetylmuramoyl-L-alanyl-D-glutamate--2,6-diaminopimelate ligase [Pseudomonadota bacterium]MDA0992815.1 UDP-N-acetylmuramoyl-L-alanyl-D-glutamate--2,6-diaminopimelate ligase [Pseudomonadota bacterium]